MRKRPNRNEQEAKHRSEMEAVFSNEHICRKLCYMQRLKTTLQRNYRGARGGQLIEFVMGTLLSMCEGDLYLARKHLWNAYKNRRFLVQRLQSTMYAKGTNMEDADNSALYEMLMKNPDEDSKHLPPRDIDTLGLPDSCTKRRRKTYGKQEIKNV